MPTAGFILAPIETLPAELPRRLRDYGFGLDDRQTQARRGGLRGLLRNEGDPEVYFPFHKPAGPLDSLRELARDCGGDHLAVFTWNAQLHHWLFRGTGKGTPAVVRKCTITITGGAREGDPAGEIASWFEKSPIRPDVAALVQEAAGPRIRPSRWFAAFGLEGASDFDELATIWEDLEPVTVALLTGQAPAKEALKKVNRVLGSLLNTDKLPAAPKSKPGQTSPLIPGAIETVRRATGAPPSGTVWHARLTAAGLYDPITQGEAYERLTAGFDKKGLGISASLGRLLGHYPREMARDPLFLSLAGADAECWNAHAFVMPFHTLAENAGKAGFTLGIFPSALEDDFRKAHGITPGKSTAKNGFAAEAFLDLPGILKVQPVEVIGAWFANKKASGIILRAEADASFKLVTFTNGKEDTTPNLPASHKLDPQMLAHAARNLWPRDAFAGLGFEDLLEPGPFEPDTDFVPSIEEVSVQTFTIFIVTGSPLIGRSYARFLAARPELRVEYVVRKEGEFQLFFERPNGKNWKCSVRRREEERYLDPARDTEYDQLMIVAGDRIMVRERFKSEPRPFDGGGVVDLRLVELDSLFRIALFENPEAQPEVLFGPQGKELAVPAVFERSELQEGVKLRLAQGGKPEEIGRSLSELGEALATLPAGTALTLATVSSLPGYYTGEHVMRGTVEAGGIFQITATRPLVTVQALKTAIEVAAAVPRRRLPAAETEAAVALAAARQDERMDRLKPVYENEALTVMNGDEALRILAGYLLRERDGATWWIAQFPSFEL